MSKAQKITCIVFAVLFLAIGLFVIIWYFGDTYKGFYQIANKEFEIAGLKDGFTPQGMCYEKQNDVFLLSGYFKNSPSRVYVVDGKTQKEIKFFTIKEDKSDYVGHAGGITTDGSFVWLVGGGKVLTLSFADVLTVENGKSVDAISSFESKNGADFATVSDGKLWIGEFYREKNYKTDESHHIQTPSGETNYAVSFCYTINHEKTNGIESETPIMALSTPSLVQGMDFAGDKIVISTSYSLPNSHLYVYKNVLNTTTDKSFDFDGTEIPLYILDKQDILKDIEAPCMSEEIVCKNGRVFVLFENACKKYGAVTREQLKNVYSFEI